jgi:adenosylcobinamide-GDP ribazoletransferase
MKFTFPLALTFLTKIPWPGTIQAEPQDLARALFWFPWVGAILGLVYLGAWTGFNALLPAPASAALLVCLTVLLTGGLHLDGLADTVDGLGGGQNPEERLHIMKDSRVGAFGVMSLILVLLAKFALFMAAGQKGVRADFLLFPIVSRWGMVYLAYLSRYARPEGGLGEAMTNKITRRTAVGATLSTLVLALLIFRLKGLVVLLGAEVLVWLLVRFFNRKLGGITGDVLGAVNEVMEVAVLGGVLLLV